MNDKVIGFNNLNENDKFVLLLSRLTISEADTKIITDLIQSEKLNWSRIFQVAVQNKVLGLLYNNLKRLILISYIPMRYERNAKFFFLGNAIRNNELLKEYEKVIHALTQAGIKAVPLKGIYLVPNMYQEYGAREMSDVDLLVKREDSAKILEIMSDLGYEQGSYKKDTHKVEPYSREKKMLWNMNMNTMIPFVKICDSQYAECIKFDISFNLDMKLAPNPVPSMLERAYQSDGLWYLRPSDFFIHLCCHLYKEASNAEWIYQNKDVNIIKFCDVREYILQKMRTEDIQEAIHAVLECRVNQAVYYTIFYLKMIYQDGYEDKMLEELEISDLSFLDQFGQNNFKEPVKFKKSFWERIFSESNAEELREMSKFVNKYRKL